MFHFRKIKKSLNLQFAISLAIIGIISFFSFIFHDLFSYKVVALFLLFSVSIIAALFDILPVLFSAILSALILNFFFIPPFFTFHISSTEDIFLFLIYIFVALVNAVLTFKIRKEETKSRDREEKENTIKLYNTLLNSLSHELRTPISTIMGAVDTLKESKDKLTNQNRNDLLDEINKASQRLNRQVENLLNVSRLESGMLKLKKDWCDVNELIYNTLHKIGDYTNNHKIVFELSENLPLCKLDIGVLEQIVHNLVYNATQYSPSNSEIKIRSKFESPNLIICISDNGPGIPEEFQNLVFEKFYRLSGTKTGSSGLGLSIVKGFVEAHNGKIFLENLEKGGAKFTIGIPVETTFLNNLKND